jgi:protease I
MMTTNYKNRSVLLFLPATDFNEQEYLLISDQLVKAGVKTFIVSDSSFLCLGSSGMKVKNDVQLYNVHESNFGGFIIVGGKGTRNYWNNKTLQLIAQRFVKSKKTVGAICSAPIILARAGLIKSAATCYTDDIKELECEGISFKNSAVVSENRIITGRDPASSCEFVKAFLYELSKN